MPTSNQATASGATLSVDDLEAALRLLSVEERAVKTDWRKLILGLLEFISFGIVIFAIPIGLLVIWFNPGLGWGLLKAAVIAAIIFCVWAVLWGDEAPSKDKIDQMRATLGENLSKTSKAAWEKRSEALDLFIGLLILPFLIGLAWLVYSLVTTGKISQLSLGLIALSVLILMVLVAIDQYRESEYLLQVTHLRDKLESRLQEVSTTGSNEVPLSSKEINLLSQVETRLEMQQVENKVAQVKHERPDEQLYSVAIAREPLKYLAEREPETREAIREAWDELQTEPKPPEAQPTLGQENGFVIRRGQYNINYLVDDQKQRIDVVKIQEIHQEEPPHAP